MNKEVNYGMYFIRQKDDVSTCIRVLIICLSLFPSYMSKTPIRPKRNNKCDKKSNVKES